MSISIKIHKTPVRLVVSLCDTSLLGKKFEEKDCELDIRKRFYEGEKKSESEMIEILRDAMDINAVGEESVNFLVKNKFITSSQIKKVAKIPIVTIFAL